MSGSPGGTGVLLGALRPRGAGSTLHPVPLPHGLGPPKASRQTLPDSRSPAATLPKASRTHRVPHTTAASLPASPRVTGLGLENNPGITVKQRFLGANPSIPDCSQQPHEAEIPLAPIPQSGALRPGKQHPGEWLARAPRLAPPGPACASTVPRGCRLTPDSPRGAGSCPGGCSVQAQLPWRRLLGCLP